MAVVNGVRRIIRGGLGVASGLLALLLPGVVSGLQVGDAALVDKRKVVYGLRIADGSLHKTIVPYQSVDNAEEEISFLRHPSVLAEIELTAEQEKDLVSIVSGLESDLERAAANAEPGIEGRRKQIREWENAAARFRQSLEEVLLPHQITRLKQIRIRFGIRQFGLVGFASHAGGPLQDLELSLGEQARLINEGVELAKAYRPKSDRLKKDYLEKVVERLPNAARDLFKQQFFEALESRLPVVDVMHWQAEHAEEIHESMQRTGKMEFPYPGLLLPSSYSVDVDGRLVNLLESQKFSPRIQERVDRRLSVLRDYLNFIQLVNLLLREEVRLFLDLQDDQIAELQECKDRVERANDKLKASQSQSSDQEFIDSESSRMGREGIQAIDNILLPHQRDGLARLSEVSDFVVGGFTFALKYGQGGKRLELTDRQIAEIQNMTLDYVKKMNDLTRQWEQEILERMLAVLDEQTRRQLTQLMGEPLKHNGCCIDLLLAQLEYPVTGQ